MPFHLTLRSLLQHRLDRKIYRASVKVALVLGEEGKIHLDRHWLANSPFMYHLTGDSEVRTVNTSRLHS